MNEQRHKSHLSIDPENMTLSAKAFWNIMKMFIPIAFMAGIWWVGQKTTTEQIITKQQKTQVVVEEQKEDIGEIQAVQEVCGVRRGEAVA